MLTKKLSQVERQTLEHPKCPGFSLEDDDIRAGGRNPEFCWGIGDIDSPAHHRSRAKQHGADHIGLGPSSGPAASRATTTRPRNNQWGGTGFDVDVSRVEEVGDRLEGLPWEEDIFEDDEHMKEVRRAILILNQAFTVSVYTLSWCSI
jgi:hypothetical protein